MFLIPLILVWSKRVRRGLTASEGDLPAMLLAYTYESLECEGIVLQ